MKGGTVPTAVYVVVVAGAQPADVVNLVPFGRTRDLPLTRDLAVAEAVGRVVAADVGEHQKARTRVALVERPSDVGIRVVRPGDVAQHVFGGVTA